MHAIDVMTTNVITAREETSVQEIAGLMLKHRISALPIVDTDQRVVGIVSEGDLLRRAENETETRYPWWLAPFQPNAKQALDFVKTHGLKARDVMTRGVIAITEDTTLREIADILAKKHIKRVPVTRHNQLVGIVSRSNLLQGLATTANADLPPGTPDDRTIRANLMRALSDQAGVDSRAINVIVENGVVRLWGLVETREEAKAAQVAAETTPGVKAVENNLGQMPGWIWAN
jgi:CBS domain-containing protein